MVLKWTGILLVVIFIFAQFFWNCGTTDWFQLGGIVREMRRVRVQNVNEMFNFKSRLKYVRNVVGQSTLFLIRITYRRREIALCTCGK